MVRNTIILIAILALLTSCTTIATRENGERLTITGNGKATWKDGTSIETVPLIEFPPLKLEQ